jgi:hypothetical protein
VAIAVFIDHQKLTLAAFDEVDRRVHAAIADSGPAGSSTIPSMERTAR